MTMLVSIKAAQLQARKAREQVKASLLTTLIGEIEGEVSRLDMSARTDEKVGSISLATVKSFLKKNAEAQSQISDAAKVQVLKEEATVLTTLLPSQLTEDELIKIVREAFESGAKSKSLIMKLLKERYAGAYDGKMASQVVDNMFRINL